MKYSLNFNEYFPFFPKCFSIYFTNIGIEENDRQLYWGLTECNTQAILFTENAESKPILEILLEGLIAPKDTINFLIMLRYALQMLYYKYKGRFSNFSLNQVFAKLYVDSFRIEHVPNLEGFPEPTYTKYLISKFVPYFPSFHNIVFGFDEHTMGFDFSLPEDYQEEIYDVIVENRHIFNIDEKSFRESFPPNWLHSEIEPLETKNYLGFIFGSKTYNASVVFQKDVEFPIFLQTFTKPRKDFNLSMVAHMIDIQHSYCPNFRNITSLVLEPTEEDLKDDILMLMMGYQSIAKENNPRVIARNIIKRNYDGIVSSNLVVC